MWQLKWKLYFLSIKYAFTIILKYYYFTNTNHFNEFANLTVILVMVFGHGENDYWSTILLM